MKVYKATVRQGGYDITKPFISQLTTEPLVVLSTKYYLNEEKRQEFADKINEAALLLGKTLKVHIDFETIEVEE